MCLSLPTSIQLSPPLYLATPQNRRHQKVQDKQKASENFEKLEASAKGSMHVMEEREEKLTNSKVSLEHELMKATKENLLLRQRVNDMIFERKLFDAEKLKVQQAEKQRIISLQRALNDVSEQRDELRLEVEEKGRIEMLRTTRPKRRAPAIPADRARHVGSIESNPGRSAALIGTRTSSTTSTSADIVIPARTGIFPLKSSLEEPHPAPKRRRRLSSVVRGVVNSSEESISRSAAIQSRAEEALATAKASMALFDAKQAEKARTEAEIDQQLKDIAASVKEIVKSAEKSRVLEVQTLLEDGNKCALVFEKDRAVKTSESRADAPPLLTAALPGPPVPPLPVMEGVPAQAVHKSEEEISDEEKQRGSETEDKLFQRKQGAQNLDFKALPPLAVSVSKLSTTEAPETPERSVCERERVPSMSEIEEDLRQSRSPVERGNIAVDFFRRLSLEVSGNGLSDFVAKQADQNASAGDHKDQDNHDSHHHQQEQGQGQGHGQETENASTKLMSGKADDLLQLLDEEQDLLTELQSASTEVANAFRSARGSIDSNGSTAPELPEYPGSPFKPPEKAPSLPEMPPSFCVDGIIVSSAKTSHVYNVTIYSPPSSPLIDLL